MDVLPDIITTDLSVLFCGTAVPCAVTRGHYHAGRGDDFWRLLHEAGFTPRRLAAYDDSTLPTLGCGLTDLVPMTPTTQQRAAHDVGRLVRTVDAWRPRWLAFSSKTAGQAAARGLGMTVTGLGLASWQVGDSEVFVLPSPSGANRRRDYDGRPTRLEWWSELRELTQDLARTAHNAPTRTRSR